LEAKEKVMMKRIGIAGALLVVAFAMSAIGAQVASAALGCYLVSQFVNELKAGNWTDGTCTVEATRRLTTKWVKVKELLFKTTGNLWCAQLDEENTEGFFTEGNCRTENTVANAKLWTEVKVLPDISITLGSYPLHLNYLSNTVATALETTGGAELTGRGLHVLYLTGELTSLGTFRAIFLKVEKNREPCFNQGLEANGEVLTEGSFHLVYTSLPGSSQGLQIGILYLVKELNGANGIQCRRAGIEVKVKGSVIGSINTLPEGEGERIGQKSVLSGTRGKQSIRAYWNDAGVGLLAQLLSSVGAGFLEFNEVVEGEPEATALNGAMYEITTI
jgi:hypothetical protein